VQRIDVARCLNAITRKSGHATTGRARAALSSLFTWAMKQGQATHNPVIGTENPITASRDRVLKDTELAAIWRACGDDDFGKIVRLLICTGCRREEIGGLRWRPEINLDDATITLPKERTKNRHEHVLPITPLAMQIIRSIQERVGRVHLFGDRSAAGFNAWSAHMRELGKRLHGIAPWKLHDLRRSLASWLADHGDVEPHIIEAILNHYSGHRSGVAGIYNRAKYARQIRAALSLWDDHLRSLIEGGRRKVLAFPQAAQETA
jgi:integrase